MDLPFTASSALDQGLLLSFCSLALTMLSETKLCFRVTLGTRLQRPQKHTQSWPGRGLGPDIKSFTQKMRRPWSRIRPASGSSELVRESSPLVMFLWTLLTPGRWESLFPKPI